MVADDQRSLANHVTAATNVGVVCWTHSIWLSFFEQLLMQRQLNMSRDRNIEPHFASAPPSQRPER